MNNNGISKANDFSQGAVWRLIISQAVPLTIARLIQLLYNVIDRVYIGHMADCGSIALTGVGLTFPIITLIMAFTSLFGMGGVPLFAMARGAGRDDKAAKIAGNSFCLLIISSAALTALGYVFRRPVLFAFGASPESYVYADSYIRIYLAGTVFSMISAGMNGYINAQGFPRIGMLSIIIGAVVNIILDPVFIFALNMGVSGAALATVISQSVSAAWVLMFLTGKKAAVRLDRSRIKLEGGIVKNILKLGAMNFIMEGTNFAVQATCNSMLSLYGGDLYVGIMTVINSIREIFMLAVSGIVNGAMPVISFNYGAKKYKRVISGIRFNTAAGVVYTLAVWLLVLSFPGLWIKIFSDEPQIISAGTEMLKLYFFGFVFMSLQFSGQTVFQSVGDARHAIFFSLLRKVIIVIPLTIILPRLGFGVKGVFGAEPVSNIIGGTACFMTMMLTVHKRIKKLAMENDTPEG